MTNPYINTASFKTSNGTEPHFMYRIAKYPRGKNAHHPKVRSKSPIGRFVFPRSDARACAAKCHGGAPIKGARFKRAPLARKLYMSACPGKIRLMLLPVRTRSY